MNDNDILKTFENVYHRLDEELKKRREIEKKIRFIEKHYKKKRRLFLRRKNFIKQYDFSNNTYHDVDWIKWRKYYHTLSIEDQRKVYDACYDIERGRFFNTKTVIYFLIGIMPLKIIEIGGSDGSLAKSILNIDMSIEYWDNYDISTLAISQTVCNDIRYKGISINKFPWDMTYEKDYNILIMSDVAEHFKEEQISLLIDKLNGLEYIYYKIPWDPSWKTYNGTHVLEMKNWEEMDQFMFKKGFEPYKIIYADKEVRSYQKLQK